jgi:hypothetical protein
MASNNQISIIITAKDEASAKLAKFTGSLDDTSQAAGRSSTAVQKAQMSWQSFAGIAVTAGVGFHSLTGFIEGSVTSANRLQSALTGLSSVSRAFGQDQKAATRAAQELANDGLMTVADAATGLKNLLATGFSLDQAITLMKRFKDSASFGRQSALSFGQAVSSATEGIKNGNSILVDNAGVTKNLSVILEEAGYSMQDVMRTSQDAGVRMALFNGILKETNPQLGDAAKLTEMFAGKQAQASAQMEVLRQQIGTALQPALLALLQTVTPTVEKFAAFTTAHPQLVAAVLIIGTAVTGLVFLLGTLGLAISGLGPLWAAMAATGTAAMTGLGVAFRGLAALVASPLIMPALVVAAALASLNLVWNAIQSIRQAMNDLDAASASAASSNRSITANHQMLLDLQKNGTPEQKKRATEVLKKGYALGTSYAPGGVALVGERGPELVNLPRGSQVMTADRTQEVVRGSGGVTIQSLVVNGQGDPESLAKLVVRQIGYKLATA